MASGPAGTPGGEPQDGKKWLMVVVPAVGVALVVGAVVVTYALNNGPDNPGGKGAGLFGGDSGKGAAAAIRPRRSPLPNSPTKLADGTAPTDPDPDLKDLGSGGLKYRDLKVGDGDECPPGATPIMDYAGWLQSNGELFDTSFKPDRQPLNMSLIELIQGWQQGVPGMKVGGIRKLVVPGDLAYGPSGKGRIPPNATLVFEMELLGFK